MSILDEYVLKPPTAQNILDIFAGQWSTMMPAGSGLTTEPGRAALFDTPHLHIARQLFGGFEGRTVVELGPLEGAHSWMLQQGGASKVVAIEANTRAFLKCLCIKEIFGLDRVQYLLGDFMHYLAQGEERFDIALASGVLYHMSEPMRLLELLSRRSDRLILWTHFYDDTIIRANKKLSHKFSRVKTARHNGHDFDWVLQSYKESLNWGGFCGGGGDTSVWLTRDSILSYLKACGFAHQWVAFEQLDHPNGPCFAVIASREPFANGQQAAVAEPVAPMGAGRVTLDEISVASDGVRVLAHFDAPTGLDAGSLGLFVGYELAGEVHMVQPGLVLRHYQAGDTSGFQPLKVIDARSQALDLSLPAIPEGRKLDAVYVGWGEHFAQMIGEAAYVRLPIEG